MAYNFRDYNPDQQLLLPPSIHDWVADDSLAHFITDVVQLLDHEGQLKPFLAAHRADGHGRAAYHPKMMLKVLLYCYCCGILSSRRIAAELERNVDLRYLSADQQPNFRTIAAFRRRHLEALKGLFATVLQLCREAGLVKLGTVAIDGRMVKANASRDKNRKKRTIEREIAELEAEVAELLQQAEEVDAEEDAEYGEGERGDELPKELRKRQDRLERLKAARERIEERREKIRARQQAKHDARAEKERETGKKPGGKPPRDPDEVADEATEDATANPTDPDSILGKTRGGYAQAYNAQASADCASQVILAADVTREYVDGPNLAPMLNQTIEAAGPPQVVVADAGYWSQSNAQMGTDETELILNPRKDYEQRFRQAKEAAPRGRIPKNATPRERMDRKLLTKHGRKHFGRRGQIEAVFGQMHNRGLRQFLLRGIEKVTAEWSLWCTSHNLLKLWRAGWASA